MKTKTEQRRVRIPAPHCDETDAPFELVLEEEEEAPCGEFIVISQEREIPALEEYLRERGSRTIH